MQVNEIRLTFYLKDFDPHKYIGFFVNKVITNLLLKQAKATDRALAGCQYNRHYLKITEQFRHSLGHHSNTEL